MDYVSLIQQLQNIALQPPSTDVEKHLPIVTDTLVVLLEHEDVGVGRLAASTVELFCRKYTSVLKEHKKLIKATERLSVTALDIGVRNKCKEALNRLKPTDETTTREHNLSYEDISLDKWLHSIIVQLLHEPDVENFNRLKSKIIIVSGVISITKVEAHDGLWMLINYRKYPSNINKKQIQSIVEHEDFCGQVLLPSDRRMMLLKSNMDAAVASSDTTSTCVDVDGYLDANPENTTATNIWFLHPNATLLAKSRTLNKQAIVLQTNVDDTEMQMQLGMEKQKKRQMGTLNRIAQRLYQLGDSVFG